MPAGVVRTTSVFSKSLTKLRADERAVNQRAAARLGGITFGGNASGAAQQRALGPGAAPRGCAWRSSLSARG